ncbi:hypothetical protein VTK73DRAFT_8484 [Phialemonium thermophilum]|uniref:F-box domain-containing protein n=1 Tax=Phialemonium thermophilum TaxID=223376 RepID=A0ABR3W8A8_9PEZI
MAEPAPGAVAPLGKLPLEIVGQIFEHLVPEPPEIGETRPVAYDQLVPGEPWYDFTRCRRALRNLHFVCRQFAQLAQPLLYRVVAILDEVGLVLFFRTMLERPDLGLRTRYFSCHLTLTQASVIRETRRALSHLLRPSQPGTVHSGYLVAVNGTMQIMNFTFPFIPAGHVDGLPQVVVFFILTRLKRLDTLLLQLPICDDDPEYEGLFGKLAELKTMPPATQQEEERPFESIRTVLLQGDPELLEHFESDECSCEIPESWGCQPQQYFPLYEAMPNMTTLEISADNGVWEDDRSPLPRGKQGPLLGAVRHLYLNETVASPRDLHLAVRQAPQLETLYMTPRRDYEFEEEAGWVAEWESLDVALQERASTLRHLDVAWFDCRGYEEFIGPDGRLASLPSFTGLEKLCVQLCVLYGSNPSAHLQTPLVDLLPPNLVEFTLEDWWWSDIDTLDASESWEASDKVTFYQGRQEYRARALAALSQFAMSCPERLPRLRKFTFLTRIPWTWTLVGYIPMHSHFDMVKDILVSHGVEFVVDEV